MTETWEREQAAHFFEEHSRRIYLYCLRQLGSPEEAEDALQATYLNAWRSLQHGCRPEKPRSWLFAIAHNVCLTSLRSRLRQGAVDPRDPDDLEAIVPSPEYNGDELIGLYAALEDLPKRQRHALLLREWRGFSYGEIASELQLSDSAVATLIFRARRAVEAALEAPAPRPRRRLARSLLGSGFGGASVVDAVRAALASHVHAKIAVGLAVGATAPLVTFGLIEDRLERLDSEAREASPARIVSPSQPRASESAPVPVSVPAPAKVSPGESWASARDGSDPAGAAPSFSAAAAPEEIPGAAPPPSTDPPEGSVPTEPPQTDPPPPPAEEEPEPVPEPEVQPPPEPVLVTLCHYTGSETNPYITITVSEHAVDAHLARGDTLGPCGA